MTTTPRSGHPGEAVTLPRFMPDDAVVVTDYAGVVEVLRSRQFHPEPPTMNEEVSGGSLTAIAGQDHIRRRRVMNRLVRTDALDHYREVLLVPAVLGELCRLHDNPDPDGVARTELVEFTRLAFTQFSAALAGFFEIPDHDRTNELLDLINAMGDQHRVKFFTGDPEPYVRRGIAAKERFRREWVEPSIDACPFSPGDDVPRSQHDLLSLLAAELDPAWQDDDLKVREIFTSIFAAGVGTSSTMMTNTIDELSYWLEDHPDERERLDDLDFLARALQETLRLHPIFPAFGRVAVEDVELSRGQHVRKGQWVAAFPGPANRDPSIFGEDADAFNPDRELRPGTERYATGFGAGSHQCLGLRVVLGDEGVGSHAHVLRLLLAAGVERDHEREAVKEPSERDTWMRYPVVFTTLAEALARFEERAA